MARRGGSSRVPRSKRSVHQDRGRGGTVRGEMARTGSGSPREASVRDRGGGGGDEYGPHLTEKKQARKQEGGRKERKPVTAVEASRAAEAALVANYVPDRRSFCCSFIPTFFSLFCFSYASCLLPFVCPYCVLFLCAGRFHFPYNFVLPSLSALHPWNYTRSAVRSGGAWPARTRHGILRHRTLRRCGRVWETFGPLQFSFRMACMVFVLRVFFLLLRLFSRVACTLSVMRQSDGTPGFSVRSSTRLNHALIFLPSR